MLQQTQVKTVIPYWERWMRTLPTVEALACVESRTLHKLWEGLGYYTRVRNMQAAARLIQDRHQGSFPQTHPEILALPGIGPYTAGAICSIAFNQPTAILDGNVIRVLSRIFAVTGDPNRRPTRDQLWRLAQDTIVAAGSNRTARVYCQLNQALMELGALVCLPREPCCTQCPVRSQCLAYKTHRVDQLPRPRSRPKPTPRRFLAFVLRKGRHYLVRQRPAGGVNAHLWEFPNLETPEPDPDLAAKKVGLNAKDLSPLSTITHSITRYRITLEVFQGQDSKSSLPGAQWRTLPELHRLPFSSAHKRIVQKLGCNAGTLARGPAAGGQRHAPFPRRRRNA